MDFADRSLVKRLRTFTSLRVSDLIYQLEINFNLLGIGESSTYTQARNTVEKHRGRTLLKGTAV